MLSVGSLQYHRPGKLNDEEENGNDLSDDLIETVIDQPSHRPIAKILVILVVLIIGLSYYTVVLLGTKHWPTSSIQSSQDLVICPLISKRKEWRELNFDDRRSYIEAVQCLATKSSKSGLKQTMYDDFSYFHSHNGNSCKSSAETGA